MKFLKYTLYSILGLVALVFVTFLFLNHNPRPEIITLPRVAHTDAAIQKLAEDLVGKMSMEEKVGMMSPLLKSNTRLIAEIVGDGMRYNNVAYFAG